MTKNNYFVSVALFIGLSGCSNLGKDNVLFVTKTSLGVDIDSKPPTVSIGYDRKEGTVAPVFENGQVLSQMAAFSTEQGFVNQAAGQSFATGNAAELMSKYLISNSTLTTRDTISMDEVLKVHKIKRSAEAKRYFFGTDTSFGLKVGLAVENGGIPDSVSLGYKRKETAYVPLIENQLSDSEIEVALPSLISTAGFENKITTDGSTLYLRQFFATGNAANYLASIPGIRQEVVPKMLPAAQVIVDFVRTLESTEPAKQKRVEKILLAVDLLAEPVVYSINKSPPLVDPSADALVSKMDPACQRLADRDCNSDGTPDFGDAGAVGDIEIARRMLKFRIVMSGNRSDEDLAKWEAVVDSNANLGD